MRPRTGALAFAFAAMLGAAACAARAVDAPRDRPLGIGHVAPATDVAAADDDVAIDGTGLPAGSGTPEAGARVFETRCASCHARGAGLGRVRNGWPYATSLFDYIRRAMPPDLDEAPSAADIYAVTAYVLAQSGAIGPTDVMDRKTLPRVAMPGKTSFRRPDGSALP